MFFEKGIFVDRQDAGRQLAQALQQYRNDNLVILALPRGGVPVGYEVAKALKAPLDVMVVRKLGTPWNPELGIGAIAPGVQVLNEALIRQLNVPVPDIERLIAREQAELERRLQSYRGDMAPLDVAGKTVILVDDGLATGFSVRAALRAVRRLRPTKLVLAVPVGAPDTVEMLEKEVDELVCLQAPEDFMAVGSWYLRFPQTTDEEVTDYLKRAKPVRAGY